MKKRLVILSMILTIFIALPAFAQLVRVQGVGNAAYKGWGGPSLKVKQQAVVDAKVNALNRYASKFTQAKRLNYEKIKEKIKNSIDLYVTDYTIVDEEVDKKAKQYRVVIQASIDASLIEVELQKISAVENVPEDQKSYITYVFVAREQRQVKSYDKRQTKRVVKSDLEEHEEIESVDEGAVSLSAKNNKDSMTTTGGSAIQKADDIEYDVTNTSEINTAMSNVFSTAGYEVVDADYVEEETEGLLDVGQFKEDFRYGSDISGRTKRNAVKGLRSIDITLLAIGTLDIGMKDKDPVSGLTRVYVSVTGKIMSLKKRFPKTVASVGPVQFSGLGPNETVAKRNALKLAAEKAANDLVAQLRMKGIH